MPTSLAKRLTLILGVTGGRGVNRSLDGISKRLGVVGKAAKAVSRAVTIMFTAFVVGAGVAVASAASFQDAMVKSTAIMGDLSDAMVKDMSDAARQVGKTTSFSATQAAESFFFLASAGLDAAQSIAALPKVAQFAQAGNFDMARATDLLTDAQSALGLTIRDDVVKNMENMVRVSDVLVKANTLANATVEQFSEALTREAGAALKTFNISVEEGVAVLAVFADQGVKAQLAGTSLSRILRLMTSAAVKNEKAYKDLGIEVFDSAGNIRFMGDIVEDMTKALKPMADKTRTAALQTLGFQARVQGVILPLLSTSDALRKYFEDMKKAGGKTKEVADKQLRSFKEQIGLVRDRLKDLAIDFGHKLLDPVLKFAFAIEKLVKMTAEWIKQNDKTVEQIGFVVGALAAVKLAIIAINSPILLSAAAVFLLIVAWKKLRGEFDSLADKREDITSSISNELSRIDASNNLFNKFLMSDQERNRIAKDAKNKIIDLETQLLNLSDTAEDSGFGAVLGKTFDDLLDKARPFFNKLKEEFNEFAQSPVPVEKLFKFDAEAFSKANETEFLAAARKISAKAEAELAVFGEEPDTEPLLAIPPDFNERAAEALANVETLTEGFRILGAVIRTDVGVGGTLAFKGLLGGGRAAFKGIETFSKAFFKGEKDRQISFGQLTKSIWLSTKAAALQAIADELKAIAKRNAIRALEALGLGILGATGGNPQGFAAAAKFAAAAALAGAGAAVISGAAGAARERAAEALAPRGAGPGELEGFREEERRRKEANELARFRGEPEPFPGDSTQRAGTTGASTIRGSVTQAAPRQITIAPVTTIQGEIILIGENVEEAADKFSDFIVAKIQEATEGGAFDG